MKLSTSKLLLSITLVSVMLGIIMRYYNLNWGAPFYFHPDERNIASSITQLRLFSQMNPHFFAYGSLPIYSIYLLGILWNYFLQLTGSQNQNVYSVLFEQAIILSRILSAGLSVGVLLLIYKTTQRIATQQAAYFAVLLASLSVGFIQYAHFGTFEMWLTFFGLLQLYTTLLFLQTNRIRYFIITSIITGLLIVIKISSIALVALPILALMFWIKKNHKEKNIVKRVLKSLPLFVIFSFVLFLIICSIFLITSPFAILDYKSFEGSISYESAVALGTLPVFYTGGFFNTIPILHQLLYVYPFLLNPIFTVLFTISFVYLIIKTVKERNSTYFFLLLAFCIIFITQAIVFVKWTRYMIPTLPFVYIIIAIGIESFLRYITRLYSHQKRILLSAFCIVFLVSFVSSFSFFITAYVQDDTRIAAYHFAKKSIPPNAIILSEVYDMGIVPFNSLSSSITLYNFYDLDNGGPQGISPQQIIAGYDYFILPSQRVIRNRMLNPQKFPQGNIFYSELVENNLGFTKIYETPCDIFCTIAYIGNPIYNVEETANVFDRPTIMIYKKQ